MSWAVEEWKDGLSGKALQKIQEFECQLDKLKKERQQKQFQLESLEAALQKQKQKFDSEKSEASALKRENQSLVESCDNLEKARQKLSHDLQVKEQQVNCLEGQLNASKKQIERLEQELKKYKNDLERSHSSSSSSDLQPYATPQKTFTAPVTPGYRHHESKLEELQEKYSQEVEERKRIEAELKVLQVKLLNQSSVSHKDIARQQAGSSIFPWQQEQTPSKRRNAAASSVWIGEETPLRQNQPSSFMAQGNVSANSQQADQLRALNQDLKIKVAELEDRLQTQDKDIKTQMNKFIETQSLLDKARKDFAEKERSLVKLQDDFAKMTSQHEQALAKGTSLEQKLKQVTEEMNCQRHNSDSTRRALEQKLKDQEKEAQKELAHLQSSHQALDQQFNQTKNKMSQEIQQMKKEANIFQSDIDKITALKNRLEKDLEEQKQRLFKSEQGLQSSQAKETELKKKCDEMQREHNSLSSQLQQTTKTVNQLQEERNSNESSLRQSRNMVDDLKAKTEAQSEELKSLNKKLERQSQASAQDIGDLKKTLGAVEAKEKSCQEELNKQKREVEQLQNQLHAVQKEKQMCSEAKQKEIEQLQNQLHAVEKEKHDFQMCSEAKQKEIEQVKGEYEKIVEWKNEKSQLIENTESDRNTMLSKIDELEKVSAAQKCIQEKLEDQDKEKQSQIDSLKGELLNKCMELEEKGRMYDEMLQKYNDANQKHAKEAENTSAQMQKLQNEVKDLEMRLQAETNKIERMELSHSDLLVQLEGACDLAKSKDSIIELHQREISDLQETLSQSNARQEQLLARLEEEKSALVKDCEESVAIKDAETEEAKLNLMKCEQDILLLKDQVASLDSAVTLQKGLNAKLQSRQADLLQNNEALSQKINEGEKREDELMNEVKALSEQAKSLTVLQDQCTEFAEAAEQSKLSLKNLQDVHNQTVEELQTQKTTMEKFEIQLSELEGHVSSLEAEKCCLIENLEKETREKTDLSSRYENLFEAHNAICEEKTDLQKQVLSISADLAENTARLEAVNHDLTTSNVLCAETKSHVESLKMQLDTHVNLNSNLEKNLAEKTDKIERLEADVSQWSEKFSEAVEAHVAEMEKHLEKYRNVKEQLNVLKAQLQQKCQETEDFERQMASCSSEISKLKEDLVLSDAKLQQVSEDYDRTSQEMSRYKQSASSLAQQLEDLTAALDAYKSREKAENHEIQKLKDQLSEAEQERSKASEALKEKNVNLNKIKVQLEMLQMDLEDNEACITSYDSQIEGLKGTVGILEAKLDKTEAERSDLAVALDGVQDQLATKTTEISQLTECLENSQKKQLDHSSLTSELQATNENLKVALEAEVCKRTNIETIYSNLTEQKHKVDEDLQELQKDYQHALEGLDSLKQKNDELQDVIQNLTNELETLKSALEQAREQMESTSLKNTEFEKQHTELSQQLLMLQNEQLLFSDKYSQLLSKVVEQQSLIAQFEDKEEARGLNAALEIHQENTTEECDRPGPSSSEDLKTCSPDVITAVNESVETESKDLEGPQLVSVGEPCASAEERLQEKSKELEDLSHAFEEAVRTLEEQQDVQLKELRVQHDAELSLLQEQMEAKIAEERKHTEMLTSQLEVTRQQMEELNLASQSLLLEAGSDAAQTVTEEAASVSIKDGCDKEEEVDDGEFFDAPGSPDESVVTEAEGDVLLPVLPLMTCTQGNPEEQNVSPVELQASNDAMKQAEDLQTLQAQYELLTAEMAVRKDICNDMENKVQELEKEKTDYHKMMESKAGLVQALTSQTETMTEEINSLKLQVQTSNSQLSDVLEMVEGLEHAKHGWDDKFFQIESELKRTRSEKANLEKHILSMEVDLESMQEQKDRLESELESLRKVNNSLEQDLSTAVTERGQLKQELFSCSDDREKEGQALMKLKEKTELLEKKKRGAEELIKILEDDVHAGKKELAESSNKIDSLILENEKLLEQALCLEQNVATLCQEKEKLVAELVQCKAGDDTVLRQSENMAVKIHALQDENVKLSQSLESSLLEKGEIAARLISTQEEVAQMRTGIEKLKVRIESDERKKNHMSQLLKAAQRKSDSLQDNIEKLERERVLSDQNLEDAVLQAETAKAELEDLEAEKEALSAKIVAVTNDLNNLKEEKDRLEKELLQRLEEEKEKLCSSHLAELQGLVDEKQRWTEAREQLKALAAEWEEKAQAESARNEALQTTTTSLQSNVKQLEMQLETANAMNTELTEKINALQESNLNFQNQLESQSRTAEEALQQTLASLNSQLYDSQQEVQNQKLSLETLGAEKQELASKLADIERSLVEMKEHGVNQEEALKRAQQLHVEELRVLREEMAETVAAAESKSTELLSDSSSLRTSEQQLTTALAELQSQHEQCKPAQDELNKKIAKLSKERDGIFSKMNLWMKSCKQLESEKQALLLELQAQDKLESPKASPKQAGDDEAEADLKAQLDELKEALEEKTREADESMDRCCSLMVKVHKLEEANESLQHKLKRLTSNQPSSASKNRKSTSTRAESEDKSNRTPGPDSSRTIAREEPDGHASAKRTRAQAETPNKAEEALKNLAKRLKAGTPQKGVEDEDFTPEGLPERVMKGFADIPRGEMSPFIMRRTTVQRCSPRLVAQKSMAAQHVSSSAEPSTHGQKPPAEGSSSQEGLNGGVLASVINSPRLRGQESPSVCLEQRKTRRSSNARRTSDQHTKSRQPATPAKQDENCHVQ